MLDRPKPGTQPSLETPSPAKPDVPRTNTPTAAGGAIEAGSKTAIPTLISILSALGRPVMGIYDTDSDKNSAQDIGTNESREKEISGALTAHGAASVQKCDPCFETVAGIPDPRKSDKPEQMMEFLIQKSRWSDHTMTFEN